MRRLLLLLVCAGAAVALPGGLHHRVSPRFRALQVNALEKSHIPTLPVWGDTNPSPDGHYSGSARARAWKEEAYRRKIRQAATAPAREAREAARAAARRATLECNMCVGAATGRLRSSLKTRLPAGTDIRTEALAWCHSGGTPCNGGAPLTPAKEAAWKRALQVIIARNPRGSNTATVGASAREVIGYH